MTSPKNLLYFFLFLLFTSCGEKETPKPIISITTFSPESGIPGQEVVITGLNLSTVNEVLFGSIPATMLDNPTATTIRVTVPENATTDFIVVRSADQEVISPKKFTTHQQPTISSISPLSRAVNEVFTISGTNFSNIAANNVVKINGHSLKVTSASSTSLQVMATPGTTTGIIELTANGLTTMSADQLVFLPHTISSVKSMAYNYALTGTGIGYNLQILGGIFSETKEEVTVTFNGVPATTYTPYKNNMSITVPAGATSGQLAIKIGAFTVETPYDIYPGIWTKKADLSGPNRQIATAFSIGNKAYVLTGVDGVGATATFFKDVWEYNTVTNQWTQKADFPGVGRSGAVSFSINGKGYMGTGINLSGALKDFWEYDPTTDQWTQKADFGGIARSRGIGFAIDGFGYIGSGSSNDLYKYDPTLNQWTQVASLSVGVGNDADVAVVASRAYVTFGTFGGGNALWEYNPVNNQWTQKTNFPSTPRSGGFGFSINGKAYFGGGKDFVNDDVWEYNPATNTWKQVAHILGNFKSWPISFEIGGKGYVGISGAGSSKDLWVFEP